MRLQAKRINGAYWFKNAFEILAILILLISCREKGSNINSDPKQNPDSSQTGLNYYQEPFRPQFHFSPEENWMNDPNGLVYNDGIYHLFYQYYPEDIVWGPMHWGHATSTDLIHWKHQDIALYPDELGYIFSGSAVVDHGNTSGLGSEGKDPLVAIFTYHDPEKKKSGTPGHETQGIAFSNDNGVTWTKYDKNPVLVDTEKIDFRDPKVFWHDESEHWIMTLAVGDHAEFYRSPDLKNWEFLSEFGKDVGAHGGVWECPDLFKMKVEGEDEAQWVLLISINPGGPNGGSGTQYFIGDFDGKEFNTKQKVTKWLDHGADNYAGVTFSNVPDGRHLFIGWMTNWNYAQKVPTEKWRSAMTLPRELSLVKDKNEFFVSSRVISDFDKLSTMVLDEKKISLVEALTFSANFEQAEITWKQKLDKRVDLVLKNGSGDSLMVSIDPVHKEVLLDRSKSGKIDFSESFAESIHVLPIVSTNRETDVRIILDRSSIELFIDEGRYVMTEQFFTNAPFSELVLRSKEETEINDLKINKISNTWNNE